MSHNLVISREQHPLPTCRTLNTKRTIFLLQTRRNSRFLTILSEQSPGENKNHWKGEFLHLYTAITSPSMFLPLCPAVEYESPSDSRGPPLPSVSLGALLRHLSHPSPPSFYFPLWVQDPSIGDPHTHVTLTTTPTPTSSPSSFSRYRHALLGAASVQ